MMGPLLRRGPRLRMPAMEPTKEALTKATKLTKVTKVTKLKATKLTKAMKLLLPPGQPHR